MTSPDDPLRRWRHDLVNQLSIIDGVCKLMTHESAPDDPRRADLDIIQSAVTRAVELVQAQPTSLQQE